MARFGKGRVEKMMLIFSTWLDLVRVGLRGAEDADI